MIKLFDTLTIRELNRYLYPDDARLHNGVRGIYLGNFVRWDPKAQHEKMIDQFDYHGLTFRGHLTPTITRIVMSIWGSTTF